MKNRKYYRCKMGYKISCLVCKMRYLLGGVQIARVLKNKELVNTKLATNYGGWMYCTACNKNIGYLCYVTYDNLKLNYECNYGSIGSAFLDFEDSQNGCDCNQELIIIKNRFCCPDDKAPLITILNKNVKRYEITCKACGNRYKRKG